MHFLEWLCSAHNLDQREHSEWLSFIKQILWFNNEHFISLLQEVFIMWAFCFFLSSSFSLTSLRKAENAASNRVTVSDFYVITNTRKWWFMVPGPVFCAHIGHLSSISYSVELFRYSQVLLMAHADLVLYSVSLWWSRLIILLGKHALTQLPWLQPQGSEQLEQLLGSESRLSCCSRLGCSASWGGKGIY